MGHLCFVSLFPEYFDAAMRTSIVGRAVCAGRITWDFIQIRDFSTDRHRRVDDSPYGGGAGLVMKPEPLVAAIEEARRRHPEGRVVLTSPQGRRFVQDTARRLAACGSVTFVCGHYEGVDERVRGYVDEELSIGDFVLTGGELAAAMMADAVCRLWPGVLGNDESSVDESFSRQGWLEYPQYTRPVEFRGERVPEILLSGNHGAVDAWRRAAAIERTRERRPDLYAALAATLPPATSGKRKKRSAPPVEESGQLSSRPESGTAATPTAPEADGSESS